MSKSKKSAKKPALVLLAVVLSLMAVILTTSTVNSHTIRKRIDGKYASVQMPSWLYLSNKRYNDRSLWDNSPGVKENWTYTYLPIAKEVTLKDMHDLLEKTLKSAGYSIAPNTNTGPSALTGLEAQGNGISLLVNINADTSKSGGYYEPTSIVQDVEVQAYE